MNQYAVPGQPSMLLVVDTLTVLICYSCSLDAPIELRSIHSVSAPYNIYRACLKPEQDLQP